MSTLIEHARSGDASCKLHGRDLWNRDLRSWFTQLKSLLKNALGFRVVIAAQAVQYSIPQTIGPVPSRIGGVNPDSGRFERDFG
jgi:hypothetical protein